MNIPYTRNPFLQSHRINCLQNRDAIQSQGYIRRMYNLNQEYIQDLNISRGFIRPQGCFLLQKLPNVLYINNSNINVTQNAIFNGTQNAVFNGTQNAIFNGTQNIIFNGTQNIILNNIQSNINNGSQQLGNNYCNKLTNSQRLQSLNNIVCNQYQLQGKEKSYLPIKENKNEKKEHASINIFVTPYIEGNDIEAVNKEKYKIPYECRKLVSGKMILKINFEDVINKYKEITSIDIIQTKNDENYPITKKVENGEKEIYVHLKTNSKGQYETKISFKKDNEEIIGFLIELESTRSNRHAKEKKKIKLIYSLLPKYESESVLAIVNEISKKITNFFKNLEKYLKEKKLIFLGNENKKFFLKQIQDAIEEGFTKEILSNVEKFFNDIEDTKKFKLLIMCFDYLYICIVDVIKNIDIFKSINSTNDEGIMRYFYHNFKKFMGEYGSGYCKKNDIILMKKFTDRKRSCESEGDECYGKRQRLDIITGNNGIHTNEYSDSESFIS